MPVEERAPATALSAEQWSLKTVRGFSLLDDRLAENPIG